MRYRKELGLAAACFLMALACRLAAAPNESAETAARIAPKLLRFHVLANSNSAADQAVKLKVKDVLLKELEQALGDEDAATPISDSDAAARADTPISGDDTAARAGDETADSQISGEDAAARAGSETADGKAAIVRYISENRGQLEDAAAACVSSLGFGYGAQIEITREYYPTKAYGDIVLPRGVYDSVRVTLGEGRGRNWWCLIYPSLCFVDATHAIVPEQSKSELAALVGEDDYAALLAQDGAELSVHFRLWDWISDLLFQASCCCSFRMIPSSAHS